MNNSWIYGSEFESIVCNSNLTAALVQVLTCNSHFHMLKSSCPLLFTEDSSREWEMVVPLWWEGHAPGLGSFPLARPDISPKGHRKFNLRFRRYEWEGIPEASRPFLPRGRRNVGRSWRRGGMYLYEFVAELGLEYRSSDFSPNSLGPCCLLPSKSSEETFSRSQRRPGSEPGTRGHSLYPCGAPRG